MDVRRDVVWRGLARATKCVCVCVRVIQALSKSPWGQLLSNLHVFMPFMISSFDLIYQNSFSIEIDVQLKYIEGCYLDTDKTRAQCIQFDGCKILMVKFMLRAENVDDHHNRLVRILETFLCRPLCLPELRDFRPTIAKWINYSNDRRLNSHSVF